MTAAATADFESVTELAGEEVSGEQVFRLYNRYHWAGEFCRDKDVLEAACGTGPGLGYIGALAKSLVACDISGPIVSRARAHYGDRFPILERDAAATGLPDKSLDVVMIFEALYYLPDARAFVAECRRLLRPGGRVLVVNANKDLYDFNPSPFSTVYHGAVELTELFGEQGFDVALEGSMPLGEVSLKQRITRPLKWLAVRLGLIPRTMAGKRLLKRLVFGRPATMPAEIVPGMAAVEKLTPIPGDRPCTTHKIIFCNATLRPEAV